MTFDRSAIPERLRAHLAERGWLHPGDRVLVACSGGLDSLVLLHLLRFALPEFGVRVEAAHFDHGMRNGSEEDALWLRGLARAWEIPLRSERSSVVPRSEAEARALRYRFLERARRESGAARVLTAHHADDQAETVLFRLLRGTGLDGLRGIPEVRESLLRPLLPFDRIELEAYAREVGIRPREDPSNRSLRFTRNRIRHELFPLLEEIRPGARDAILRLAEHAEAGVRLRDRLLAPILESVVAGRSGRGVVLDRVRLLALGEVERAGVLRRVVASFGGVLSRSATAIAGEFVARGESGSEVALAGDLILSRSFDRIVLRRADRRGTRGAMRGGDARGAAPDSEAALAIPGPGDGAGKVVCAGRPYRVRWGREGAAGAAPDTWARFDPARLHFPLRVRSWEPGDRTRTPGGGKKLKKLFGELRVPVEERHSLPILVDADGLVLWIPGRHRAPEEGAGSGAWRVEVGEGAL